MSNFIAILQTNNSTNDYILTQFKCDKKQLFRKIFEIFMNIFIEIELKCQACKQKAFVIREP